MKFSYIFLMQKKRIWKDILIVFMMCILFNPVVISNIENFEEKTGMQKIYRDATYYNATIIIVSYIYGVEKYDNDEIVLRSWKQAFLPGILYISDEDGVKVFNIAGGWMNSIITITGFEGFFKDWVFDKWGLYIVVWGKCEKIDVHWFR